MPDDLTGPKVAPEDMPTIRADGQVPLAAAGGGQMREQVQATTDQLNEHIGRAVELETMKANQIAASNIEAQATRVMAQHIYGDGTDENPGFLNQKGPNAIQAAGPTLDRIKADFDQLHDQAPNEDVARILTRHTNDLLNTANGQVQHHVMNQREVMDKQAHENNVQAQIEIAARTPGSPDMVMATKQAWDAGINAIVRHGNVKNGVEIDAQGNPIEVAPGQFKPVAATEMELDQFKQKFVTAHANAMLEAHMPLDAQAYMKTPEAAAAMARNPELARHLSDSINTSVVRDVQAPKLANEIVTKAILGGEGKGAALSKTETLSEDNGLKAEVRRNISQYFEDHEKAKKDATEKSDDAVFDYMGKNGGQLPPGVSATQAPAYQRAWERQMQGSRLKSDASTLFALKDMANSTNVKDQLDFTKENLRDPEYVGKLSPADLKGLQTKQAELRKAFGPGGRTPNSDTHYRMQTAVAFQTMSQMGLDPNVPKGSPEYDKVLKFRTALDQTVEDMTATSGGKLDRKTVQDAANLVAANIAHENRSVVRMTGATSTAGAAEIPQDDYNRWAAKLIAAKKPVNDKSIMYLYLKQLNAKR